MKAQLKPVTLADTSLHFARCCGCGEELVRSSRVECYETQASKWVSVECKGCGRWSPFRLEEQ